MDVKQTINLERPNLLKTQYTNETRKNQWITELHTIQQREGEKVGAYAARVKKLINKVASDGTVVAERFKVQYFTRGLNPMIMGRVYETQPGDLEAAITRAKAIEEGNNIAMQNMINRGVFNPIVQPIQTENKSQENQNFTNKPQNQVDDGIDDLIKGMENLKINKLELKIQKLEDDLRNRRRPIQPQRPMQSQSSQRREMDWSKVTCYRCGQKGHVSRVCNRFNTRRVNVMDYYDDEYEYEEAYDNEYDDEYNDYNDDYELYYNERELYPVERVTRSRANRMDPTKGFQTKEVNEPQLNDFKQKPTQESNSYMELDTTRPRRRYVPKGQGKFIRRPNKFEEGTQDYDIVEDMKNMKPNINLAQLCKINPKLASELAKATKHERVLRET